MNSIAQRLNAERVVLLGWPRAILLQLAHPLIAAGVADHSSFRSGHFAAVGRLHHTVRSMLALTFGDPRTRAAALAAILAIHRRVNGRIPAAAGRFAAGTPYSAEDPDLVLWVHATLLESIPLIYSRVVSPLTVADCDAYCREAAPVAIDLGARDPDVPRSWAALRAYLDRMYASGDIAVSGQAKEVARAVLEPPFAHYLGPIAAANRLVAIGLLPEDVRRDYDFTWSHRRERRMARTLAAIRAVRRLTPSWLACWPESRTPTETLLPTAR